MNDGTKALIAELWAQRVTRPQIGEILGLSPQYVGRVIFELGLAERPRFRCTADAVAWIKAHQPILAMRAGFGAKHANLQQQAQPA
jgi:hypothetical protein